MLSISYRIIRKIVAYLKKVIFCFFIHYVLDTTLNPLFQDSLNAFNPKSTQDLESSESLQSQDGSSVKKNKRKKKEKKTQGDRDLKVSQWIAGVIDGDGYFGLSKKGYCSLEIVVEPRDIACLAKIKERYGGSIKANSKGTSLRYRLHHREGMLSVIKDLNGLFYNPTRIEQFKKLCNSYNVQFIQASPLNYNSAYLSGLFDSDGSIYLNMTSQQMFITVSQKNRFLLDLLVDVYGGKVFMNKTKDNLTYKWIIYRKKDILEITDNYFH